MSNKILVLQKILLAVPIAGFMLVIDKAVWPFIAAISLPLLAARYLPTRLWNSDESGEVARGKSVVRIAPLLLVGATIFVLNTFPKKLVEVKKCEYELANRLEEDLPSFDKAISKSLILILLHRMDL